MSMTTRVDGRVNAKKKALSLPPPLLPPLQLADVLHARLVVLHDLREQERERREVELEFFCVFGGERSSEPSENQPSRKIDFLPSFPEPLLRPSFYLCLALGQRPVDRVDAWRVGRGHGEVVIKGEKKEERNELARECSFFTLLVVLLPRLRFCGDEESEFTTFFSFFFLLSRPSKASETQSSCPRRASLHNGLRAAPALRPGSSPAAAATRLRRLRSANAGPCRALLQRPRAPRVARRRRQDPPAARDELAQGSEGKEDVGERARKREKERANESSTTLDRSKFDWRAKVR